jgi:hypothetical protein
MSAPTHQTVRLAKGKHHGPHEGACVMELASMLAGERFSDHPRSVCPVIAAFLRTYNDGVDDERRQDLYRFASAAVGTRATPEIESARAQLCREWQAERRSRVVRFVGGCRFQLHEHGEVATATAAARLALRYVARPRPAGHEAVMAFVDRLIALGQPRSAVGVAAAPVLDPVVGASA